MGQRHRWNQNQRTYRRQLQATRPHHRRRRICVAQPQRPRPRNHNPQHQRRIPQRIPLIYIQQHQRQYQRSAPHHRSAQRCEPRGQYQRRCRHDTACHQRDISCQSTRLNTPAQIRIRLHQHPTLQPQVGHCGRQRYPRTSEHEELQIRLRHQHGQPHHL